MSNGWGDLYCSIFKSGCKVTGAVVGGLTVSGFATWGAVAAGKAIVETYGNSAGPITGAVFAGISLIVLGCGAGGGIGWGIMSYAAGDCDNHSGYSAV